MTTIPARLARATKTSSNPTEARQRVLSLYRDWYRSVSPTAYPRYIPDANHSAEPSQQAPEICSLYALNISPIYLRHVIRQRFERNRAVTDQRIIDILIAKDRMEYQETMNCWKMNDQLLGGFIQRDGGSPVQGTFLQKFYQGELVGFFCFIPHAPPFLFPPSSRLPFVVSLCV